MQFIDPNHSFYKPLWVRVLIVAFCAGWTVVELAMGEPFWAIIVGAIAIYAFYTLFLNFKAGNSEPESNAADNGKQD